MSFHQPKRLSRLTRLEDVGPHNLLTEARRQIRELERELDKLDSSEFAGWSETMRDSTLKQIELYGNLADAYEAMRDHIRGTTESLETHVKIQDGFQKAGK